MVDLFFSIIVLTKLHGGQFSRNFNLLCYRKAVNRELNMLLLECKPGPAERKISEFFTFTSPPERGQGREVHSQSHSFPKTSFGWHQTSQFGVKEEELRGLINREFNLDFAGTSRHIKQPISRVWKWEWHHAEEDKVLSGRRFIAMRKLDLMAADDVSHRTLISSRREAGLSGGGGGGVRYQNADAGRVTINPRGRREVAFTQRLSTGGVSFGLFPWKNKSPRHLSTLFRKFNYWL